MPYTLKKRILDWVNLIYMHLKILQNLTLFFTNLKNEILWKLLVKKVVKKIRIKKNTFNEKICQW